MTILLSDEKVFFLQGSIEISKVYLFKWEHNLFSFKALAGNKCDKSKDACDYSFYVNVLQKLPY